MTGTLVDLASAKKMLEFQETSKRLLFLRTSISGRTGTYIYNCKTKQSMIIVSKGADISTVLHELGHYHCGHGPRLGSSVDPATLIMLETEASQWAIQRGANGGLLAGALCTYIRTAFPYWSEDRVEEMARKLLGHSPIHENIGYVPGALEDAISACYP